MRLAYCDIETNAIDNPDSIWLVGGKMACTGEVFKFENIHTDLVARKAATEWHLSLDKMVGQNFIAYDLPILNKWLDAKLDPQKVIDTMILSRTINFNIETPKGGDTAHSLKSWGIRLGKHKGDFKDFDKLTPEMIEYWLGDLDVTEALFNKFRPQISNKNWAVAFRTEHDVQIELVRTRYHGFQFDSDLAQRLLTSVTARMQGLEDKFQEDFPPKLEVVSTLQYKETNKGVPYATVTKAKETYALTQRKGDELLCYDYTYFNPGSSTQRIDVLAAAGWKPFEKTKTHNDFNRLKVGMAYKKKIKSMSQDFYDEKKALLQQYGWTCSEDNLATLPDTAPSGAKALAQWLTLEGRRSSLAEWLGQVGKDGRIHGSTSHIGAWTGRCSHQGPNTANIASVFHGEPKNAVEEIKNKYDLHLRKCWTTPEGSYLVGCDADGIQLRVLADYMWRHFGAKMYADAIMVGNKDDETDIHNMNKKALNVPNGTRDMAKTFIYAWLLGAGVGKTAAILHIKEMEAVQARKRFEDGIEGLGDIKKKLVPHIAKKGFFLGYDGREVRVPNEHKTLAGILQNGESVLMKHTMLNFHKAARAELINFKLVTFVHDEYQVEVIGTKEEAAHLGGLIADTMLKTGEDLGFLIPTPGQFKVGKDWYETH
jgi:DNA polymerase-1